LSSDNAVRIKWLEEHWVEEGVSHNVISDVWEALDTTRRDRATLKAELERIQQLPELEWAEVCATVMIALAVLSRQGHKDIATPCVQALDRGKVYVDALKAEVAALRAAARKVIEALDNHRMRLPMSKDLGIALTDLRKLVD
jgi:hypothetical protein